MDTLTIAVLTRQLMNKHGLHGWKFKFDRAKRRAGRCSHHTKTISLSAYYVTHNDLEEITDTILHEIAHALAGPGKGHGPVWKAICVQIGAKPIRCYGEHVEMPEGRYKAVCPSCNKLYQRHRKVRLHVIYWCRKCGSQRGKLTFN